MRAADGNVQLDSFWRLLLNPWAWWQYAHNMSGAVVTGAFVMAAIGAFYLLSRKHEDQARIFVRTGVIAGVVFALLQLFPTGDGQGRMVAHNQPVTLAAMEGLFKTQPGAPLVLIGQPDTQRQDIDNPIIVPKMLSFLTYRRWKAEVKGLDAFPRTVAGEHPAALLQLSHHGGPGDDFHRRDGPARGAAVAQEAVRRALGAVDPDARCRSPTSPTPPAG